MYEEYQVAVSIADEGRCIPADSLPHLFRKFSRIAAEEQGGDTDLGLTVCKGIVEAHGGRIWAESDGPMLGARFTFTLPTVEKAGFVSPASPPQVTTSVSRRKAGEQVRVLTVDDDPQALRYIRDALVKESFAVIATADLKEIPFLLEEKKPHLVLLDLMLPGKNCQERSQTLTGCSVSTNPRWLSNSQVRRPRSHSSLHSPAQPARRYRHPRGCR